MIRPRYRLVLDEQLHAATTVTYLRRARFEGESPPLVTLSHEVAAELGHPEVLIVDVAAGEPDDVESE